MTPDWVSVTNFANINSASRPPIYFSNIICIFNDYCIRFTTLIQFNLPFTSGVATLIAILIRVA